MLERIGEALGVALAAIALIGLAVRYVLAPWLVTHVITPVRETNRQVTVNGHESDPPTLLDQVHSLRDDVEGVRQDVHTAAHMFDGHIDASAADRSHIWDAIEDLRARHRKDDPR